MLTLLKLKTKIKWKLKIWINKNLFLVYESVYSKYNKSYYNIIQDNTKITGMSVLFQWSWAVTDFTVHHGGLEIFSHKKQESVCEDDKLNFTILSLTISTNNDNVIIVKTKIILLLIFKMTLSNNLLHWILILFKTSHK